GRGRGQRGGFHPVQVAPPRAWLGRLDARVVRILSGYRPIEGGSGFCCSSRAGNEPLLFSRAAESSERSASVAPTHALRSEDSASRLTDLRPGRLSRAEDSPISGPLASPIDAPKGGDTLLVSRKCSSSGPSPGGSRCSCPVVLSAPTHGLPISPCGNSCSC